MDYKTSLLPKCFPYYENSPDYIIFKWEIPTKIIMVEFGIYEEVLSY